MTKFSRGDVVIVELRMADKPRPAVVVSIATPDSQRNMAVVVPMTTQARGGECEVAFPKPPWLFEASVVNVLGIAGVDNAKISRTIGPFPKDKFAEIVTKLKRALGL